MANQIRKFPTYRSSKHLKVAFYYDRVLQRGVQNMMEREKGDT